MNPSSRVIASVVCLTLAGFAGAGQGPGGPIDREAWARKLAGLDEGANWPAAFGLGQELAALPPDEGFAILEANWGRVRDVRARQQLLKAWFYAMPYPLRVREHPRLLNGLDLGMRDPSPEVRGWATNYLSGLAFRDFSGDLKAYREWYRANRGRPVPEVVAESVRRFAAEAARSVKSEALERARRLDRSPNIFRDVPGARQAAIDAGLLRTLRRWAWSADAGSPPIDRRLASLALDAFGRLEPPEEELRRVVLPLLDRQKPPEVRAAAIEALGGKRNAWAMGVLSEALASALEEPDHGRRTLLLRRAASTIASLEDPRAIPILIAVLEADRTPDLTYDIGYFGLNPLTGVRFDLGHDGDWWRRWWEQNKARYPEAARAIAIPAPAR